MKIESDRDVERLLASCRPKETPHGLRASVLGAALSEDAASLRWGRRLKLCFVVCPVLAAVIVLADAALSRSEHHHIEAVLNVDGLTQARPADGAMDWQTLTGDDIEANRLVGRLTEFVPNEDVIRLRGDLATFLREEFNSHDYQKYRD
ncbi:MAG: hypothetical protein JW742_04250 [Candidatus Aminicenantes bacterium]|nr:hypothetical protein [Candidatus Aminicenantes bacterium]